MFHKRDPITANEPSYNDCWLGVLIDFQQIISIRAAVVAHIWVIWKQFKKCFDNDNRFSLNNNASGSLRG